VCGGEGGIERYRWRDEWRGIERNIDGGVNGKLGGRIDRGMCGGKRRDRRKYRWRDK
jgi:hypothetical protein